MCLQAPHYDMTKHAIYLGKMFLTYAQDILGMYDECAGEEWFTDGYYKDIVDELMRDHSEAKARYDLMRQYDLEYIKENCDWNAYTETILGFQSDLETAIDKVQKCANSLRNGMFRISTIFELYREKLQMYTITEMPFEGDILQIKTKKTWEQKKKDEKEAEEMLERFGVTWEELHDKLEKHARTN